MVLNRKKDCKIIYNNDIYYVVNLGHYFKFLSYDDAKFFYDNCNKMSIDYLKWGDNQGKIWIDFFPNDIEIIIRAIEQYKFFCDKSLFFSTSREKLKKESLDCFYLFEYINSSFNSYKDKISKNRKNNSNNI